jgi:hypothetical protein
MGSSEGRSPTISLIKSIWKGPARNFPRCPSCFRFCTRPFGTYRCLLHGCFFKPNGREAHTYLCFQVCAWATLISETLIVFVVWRNQFGRRLPLALVTSIPSCFSKYVYCSPIDSPAFFIPAKLAINQRYRESSYLMKIMRFSGPCTEQIGDATQLPLALMASCSYPFIWKALPDDIWNADGAARPLLSSIHPAATFQI